MHGRSPSSWVGEKCVQLSCPTVRGSPINQGLGPLGRYEPQQWGLVRVCGELAWVHNNCPNGGMGEVQAGSSWGLGRQTTGGSKGGGGRKAAGWAGGRSGKPATKETVCSRLKKELRNPAHYSKVAGQ